MHVECKGDADWVKEYIKLVVEGIVSVGRAKIWQIWDSAKNYEQNIGVL